jgi:hypothetical protein
MLGDAMRREEEGDELETVDLRAILWVAVVLVVDVDGVDGVLLVMLLVVLGVVDTWAVVAEDCRWYLVPERVKERILLFVAGLVGFALDMEDCLLRERERGGMGAIVEDGLKESRSVGEGGEMISECVMEEK